MIDSKTIRKKFLNYFKELGHHIVPTSSLIPHNDPTLLFTNAGMNQFKDVFLGLEKRPYDAAVTVQACVRAGGKHNDLENVGYTARHHTFFEMLGNFSFSRYGKREAIQHAWKFLTEILQIPKEKLWVTVFEKDDESADIWLKEMGIDPTRFSRCGEKDNFWTMGDTGPCGPCTEIFYDHGPEIFGGPPGSPDADGDRYIEIWNLVFMQYERDASGEMKLLPKLAVDTGMGLERLAAVLQGVHTNYDIDLFQNLINAIVKLIPSSDPHHASVKVIADHIRATAFLIADGVMPSNEGRGYVLRRIMRRAIRHGFKLNQQEAFFYKLVPALIAEMGEAYPKLIESQSMIEKIILQEEQQFAKTLDQGMKLFEKSLNEIHSDTIPGEIIFKLYDTYGFPVDLTADIARERNLIVDFAGFESEMEKQRNLSQQASKFSTQITRIDHDETTEFTGYDALQQQTELSLLLPDAMILASTPFYAESGGQIGDQGVIEKDTNIFVVTDTQKQQNLIIHYGYVKQGSFQVGDKVIAKVDAEKRRATMLNHSATHLLQAALKKILGTHVMQKGSLVAADKLRFDFTHLAPMTRDEIQQVEQLVNQKIRENHSVATEVMSIEKAEKTGAVALFGEKYGEEVRVLSMGEFSKELCGGTHVKHTGDIGLFKIISETGVASGVRRIEAITGESAYLWLSQLETSWLTAAELLKSSSDDVIEKLQLLQQQKRALEKNVEQLQAKLAHQLADELIAQAKKLADVQIIITSLESASINHLKELADRLRDKLKQVVIVLASTQEQQVNLVIAVSKDLSNKIAANQLITFLAPLIGGKGGGRPDLAQAGGTQPEQLDHALTSAWNWLEERLK